MATLPTLTVTDAQVTRIQNAFTDPTGALTPVQMYKQWLKDQLIAKVIDFESQQLYNNIASQRDNVVSGVQDDLGQVSAS